MQTDKFKMMYLNFKIKELHRRLKLMENKKYPWKEFVLSLVLAFCAVISVGFFTSGNLLVFVLQNWAMTTVYVYLIILHFELYNKRQ